MLFSRRAGATSEFSLDIDDGQPRLLCMGDKGWYQRIWLSRAEAIAAAKLLLDAAEAMPATERQASTLYCSFCGKSQHDVSKMIAGPGTISICSECTALCCEIVGENGGPK